MHTIASDIRQKLNILLKRKFYGWTDPCNRIKQLEEHYRILSIYFGNKEFPYIHSLVDHNGELTVHDDYKPYKLATE